MMEGTSLGTDLFRGHTKNVREAKAHEDDPWKQLPVGGIITVSVVITFQHCCRCIGQEHSVYRRITIALKQSKTCLESQATFAHVENTLSVRCIRQDSIEFSHLRIKVAVKILLNVASERKAEKDGIFTKGHAKRNHQIKQFNVDGHWLDLVSLGGKMGTRT